MLAVSSSTAAAKLREMRELSESLPGIEDQERVLEVTACCSNAAEAAMKSSPLDERSSLVEQVLQFATDPATNPLVMIRVLDAIRSMKPQPSIELACIRESAREHAGTVRNEAAPIRDRIHAFRVSTSQISYLERTLSSDGDIDQCGRLLAELCKSISSAVPFFRLLLTLIHSQLPQ